MLPVQKRLFFSICCLLITASLLQATATDRQTAGLAGPVQKLVNKRTDFDHTKGTSTTVTSDKILYNRAGNRTLQEWFAQTYISTSKTEYVYDKNDRLTAEKSYYAGQMTSRRQIAYTPDGGRVEQRFNQDYNSKKIYLAATTSYSPAGDVMEKKEFYADGKLRSHLYSETGAEGVKWLLIHYSESGGQSSNEELEYNRQGQPVKKTYRDEYYQRKIISYFYNQKNQMSKAILEIPGDKKNTPRTWEFTYADERLIKVLLYDPAKKLISTREYLYKDNRLANEESIAYNSDEESVYSWKYVFDTQGNTIEEQYTNLLKEYTCTREWEFADQGRTVRNQIHNHEQFYTSGSETIFDKNDRVVRTLSFGADKEILSLDTKEYEDDLLISSSSSRSSGQSSKTLYAYNTYNDLIRRSTYRGDEILISQENYELEYDREGNWIKKSVYTTDNVNEIYFQLDTVYIREIDYY